MQKPTGKPLNPYICFSSYYLRYSQKYWQSLNLVVWPQTERKKYWRNFNLVVVLRSVLCYHKHCMRVFIWEHCRPLVWGAWTKPWVHRLIYRKYNWQCANAELAICTARVERHWVEPRALLHAFCHYALWAKIILADFHLAVSTQTTKPSNLIPRHIFRLYGIHTRDGS